jgi:hypothetical protein
MEQHTNTKNTNAVSDPRGEIVLMRGGGTTTATAAASSTHTASSYREEGGGVLPPLPPTSPELSACTGGGGGGGGSALPPHADPCYYYRHLPGLNPSSSTSSSITLETGGGGGGGGRAPFSSYTRHVQDPPSSILHPLSLPAKISAALMLLTLLLCLTTTTALVAIHHLDTNQMQAKLNLILTKLPDTPSLISTVRGDIMEVQAQSMMLLQAAEMQHDRTDQLFDVFRLLVRTLQNYFNGGGETDPAPENTDNTPDNNNNNNDNMNNTNNIHNNTRTHKKNTHLDVVAERRFVHASPEWPGTSISISSSSALPSP